MNKKVMVIGAGRGQLNIMRLLHRYGCHVIAVSKPGDFPGFAEADDCLYLDIREKEAILAYAQEQNIVGIVTDQLDEGVTTVAYVAEKMGLAGITYDVACKFTDKFYMRQEAAKAGIHVPYHVRVSDLSEAEHALKNDPQLQFPLIIKPELSSASKGVRKIHNIEELRQYFEAAKRHSNNGYVLLEQFITGIEYVVNSFTRDYQTTDLIVGHREYFKVPDVFIPCATFFRDAESAVTPLERRLKETNQRLVSTLRLPFGITQAEYMYDEKNDTIYLGEIAARGGGVFTSSHLIPYACGVDANDLLIREILHCPEKLRIQLKHGASAYICYLVPKGIVQSIEGIEAVQRIPGVRRAFFDNIAVGMESKSILDKYARKGPILVRGKDMEECRRIGDEVQKTLDIRVSSDGKIVPVLWK